MFLTDKQKNLLSKLQGYDGCEVKLDGCGRKIATEIDALALDLAEA
jgi:hypothetical protein